ncbi:hypothetical protein VTK73DRAFT_5917 [Phialemonium thermophilum]|uniref:Uncharacterized protein n=1 Tax=Phialemonium thermophilum TaxID=223376 RepID=A0ABR3V1C2_9PEZI
MPLGTNHLRRKIDPQATGPCAPLRKGGPTISHSQLLSVEEWGSFASEPECPHAVFLSPGTRSRSLACQHARRGNGRRKRSPEPVDMVTVVVRWHRSVDGIALEFLYGSFFAPPPSPPTPHLARLFPLPAPHTPFFVPYPPHHSRPITLVLSLSCHSRPITLIPSLSSLEICSHLILGTNLAFASRHGNASQHLVSRFPVTFTRTRCHLS